MAVEKQNVQINFASGLDTKTDPFQVEPGKMIALENTIFSKGGQLQKRNGYAQLASLPDSTSTYVTTFNGNLTAVSNKLNAYSSGSSQWVDKGTYQPMKLSTLPLIRTSTNQTQVDAVIASNGLVCTVFTDIGAGVTTYKYAVADSTTGQNIVAPTDLVPTSGTVSNGIRVVVHAGYFVIVFSTSTNHLQYQTINISNPSTASAAIDITTTYVGASRVNFDVVVFESTMYVAWSAADIRMTSYNAAFTRSTVAAGVVVAAAKVADMLSICVDSTQNTPIVWVAWYETAGTTGWVLAVNQALSSVTAVTQIINAGTVLNITCAAQSTANVSTCTVFYELSNVYSYGTGANTNLLNTVTCTQAAVASAVSTITRSLGLASKAFILDGAIYVMGVFSSSYQPTFFLVNSSGAAIAKLAYQNAGGYLALGLPGFSIDGTKVSIPYLVKDQVTAVNKDTNVPSGTQTAGIYSQTGINLVTFDFTSTNLNTAEIGSNLHLSGGFLWAYDGYVPVEQGFHLYPDNVVSTTATGAGNVVAGTYYYIATYEWSDNQGNIFRSAPSQPIVQVTTTASSTNTIKVNTLRVTAKTANPVKICLYRWSTTQQAYYQVTSVSAPTMNSTTSDHVTITDANADATILGNSLLYTTGNVIENIGPPSASAIALYRSRLFMVDSEDPNLLWYSKEVVEGAPVEMSDLFTLYVAPTITGQGTTGPITALSSLDDKLIIFKKNAIYYLVGNGPDNTGANNDYAEPIFISSTVGCDNQSSIVFMPNGLMFQSDKGIWLLSRDLNTTYIGAPVEQYNSDNVESALNIPGTNQVRFTLDSGVTLMYDYFFGQWGTFTGVPAISSTLFQNLHTFIDSYGRVFQEAPGTYLDGSRPVTMSFTTAWMSLAGLQGFERAYYFYLLGVYITPHILTVSVAFDYNTSPLQVSTIRPDNFSDPYGTSTLYGSESTYGGNSNVEQWRIFFQQQKCEAFQITISESYDSSYGVAAGAGLTLSGLDLIVGTKSTYPRLRAVRQVG